MGRYKVKREGINTTINFLENNVKIVEHYVQKLAVQYSGPCK